MTFGYCSYSYLHVTFSAILFWFVGPLCVLIPFIVRLYCSYRFNCFYRRFFWFILGFIIFELWSLDILFRCFHFKIFDAFWSTTVKDWALWQYMMYVVHIIHCFQTFLGLRFLLLKLLTTVSLLLHLNLIT